LAALATSKIAPHELHAFLEAGEALLKVFYVFGHGVEWFSLYFTNARGRNRPDTVKRGAWPGLD
jgi:hypothetical protein